MKLKNNKKCCIACFDKLITTVFIETELKKGHILVIEGTVVSFNYEESLEDVSSRPSVLRKPIFKVK